MTGTIVPHETFQKYTVATGAGNYNLPERDVDTLYGPGWPITPVTRPEDSDLPRQIDYPVAINATLQPRIGYAGMMPIAALRAAYMNITEASMPVNLIIRELASFTPILRDKVKKQRVAEGHPYQWQTVSPDRKVPFNVWLTRYKKSAKIYAAPAFFKRRDGKGDIVAMEYIDGSTLFLITNQRGELPEPDEIDPELKRFVERARKAGNFISGPPSFSPGLVQKIADGSVGIPIYARDYFKNARELQKQDRKLPTTTPAFTQIIKGIPFSFWDKNQIYFIPEPPASSVDSPYGESYIERAWTWINIIAVLTAFELGHYRTGNMPEGFLALPSTLFPSLAKIASYEREFNARMAESSQVQHARIRMAPQDSKWTQTKKPDFPKELYAQARDNIILSIGVPTSEIGQIPGRGLGGKGFETGESQKVSRQILAAEKSSLESAFNRILLDSDVDDVEFYMDYPQEEMDPATQQENLYNGFIHGIFSMNDVLTAQDKMPIGSIEDKENIANMHLIIAGQTIYVVEKMKPDESGMISPPKTAPGQDGGSPVGPEDAALQDRGAEHGPADKKTARKLMQVLELTDGKKIDAKFISLPALKAIAKKIEDEHLPETIDISDWLLKKESDWIEKEEPNPSVPPAGVDADEWRMGMKEEQEHKETVGGDQAVIANIVMDHLREDPKYYTHLKQVEPKKLDAGEDYEKRYKVVGTDVINIDTGELVPGGHHKTKAEAEAHARALYTNVPDARKVDDPNLIKVDWPEYFKHCGLCPEDAEYFGAPVSREIKFEFPKEGHANELEIVAMCPPGLPSKPALFKPAGGENPKINEKIGGPQYLREEAAWLLDQCLGFHLVPLAYIAEAADEEGAVLWFTEGGALTNPRPAEEYAPEWIERAAIFDYIISNQDRPAILKNRLTHPDDPNRVVLIDNSFSFPEDPTMYCESVFCQLMVGKPLSEENLQAIKLCIGDMPLWKDIEDLLGKKAVEKARACAQRLLDEKRITAETHAEKRNKKAK